MSIEVERTACALIGYLLAVLVFVTADYICDHFVQSKKHREDKKK